MTDLQDRIRAWTDAAVADVAPVTATEAVDRATTRSTARSPGRLWLAAAAVIVVLGLALLLVTRLGGDDEAQVTTDEAPVAPDVGFTLLGVSSAGGEPLLALRSASTAAGVDDLWTGARLEGDVPAVDLTTHAVVSITITDDACPPTLERFERTGSTGAVVDLTPVFFEKGEECEQPEIARTYVVAIEWATAGPSFRIELPADRSGQIVDRFLDVARAGPPLLDTGLVWPNDATTADRSTPEAAARSFVAHVLGPVAVEATVVPGSRSDEPNRVDVTLGDVSTSVMTVPTADGWVVIQVGESGASTSPDPPTARIPTVPDAVTVEILVTTDRGVTSTVEDAVAPDTSVALPPGTLLSIATVHRAEDGTLLSLTASHS